MVSQFLTSAGVDSFGLGVECVDTGVVTSI